MIPSSSPEFRNRKSNSVRRYHIPLFNSHDDNYTNTHRNSFSMFNYDADKKFANSPFYKNGFDESMHRPALRSFNYDNYQFLNR